MSHPNALHNRARSEALEHPAKLARRAPVDALVRRPCSRLPYLPFETRPIERHNEVVEDVAPQHSLILVQDYELPLEVSSHEHNLCAHGGTLAHGVVVRHHLVGPIADGKR